MFTVTAVTIVTVNGKLLGTILSGVTYQSCFLPSYEDNRETDEKIKNKI